MSLSVAIAVAVAVVGRPDQTNKLRGHTSEGMTNSDDCRRLFPPDVIVSRRYETTTLDARAKVIFSSARSISRSFS